MTRLGGWKGPWVVLLLMTLAAGSLLWTSWPDPPRTFSELSAPRQAEFRAHREEGLRQMELAQWERAKAELKLCLETFSGDAEVQALLGQAYLGDRLAVDRFRHTEDEEDALVDRALAAADRALSIDPECLTALKLRHKIRRHPAFRRHDPDGALADGEEILNLAPQDLKFRRKLVEWLMGEVRFRRRRPGGVAFDSMVSLEMAERHLEWMLDRAPMGTEAYAQAVHGLGAVHSRMGDFEGAVDSFELLDENIIPPEAMARGLVDLGVALYRLGRNKEAAETLLRSMRLRGTPETAWLLRVVQEEAGDGVVALPPEYRFPLPPEEVDPKSPPKIRFTEIGEALGVAKVDGAGPSAFADYDNDGDPDILAVGCDTFTALYRNDGKKFTDVTIEAGLFELESGFSANLVDYDNDGHLDIYISRCGWSGRARNILYRNRGDGTFEDRSRKSGLDDPGSGFVSLWADFDGDGLLDVYIANGVTGDGSTNRLYRNLGDGTFEDATEKAGLSERRGWGTIGVALGDYDRDGDTDIFVNGRHEAPNRLYRNRGDGIFDEIGARVGLAAPAHNGYVAFFLDYNNDTYPDILCTNLAGWDDVLEGLAHFDVPDRPEATDPEVSALYRNNRDGTFSYTSFEARLIYPHGIMGANVADLDNDGHIDLFFGTGAPDFNRLEPTVFYRNNGDGTFANITRYAGLGHLGKGHGFTFADFDLDGDLDIYAPQGGFYHGDLWANPFYRNEAGSENHWLHLKLRGVKSNRFAVGAQVTLRSGEMTQYREVEGGIGFGSTNSYPVEFGLGDRTKIDEIEILWPSGGRQVLKCPPIDSMIQVEEFGEGWKVLHEGKR